jgi:hypothetical protein
MPGLLDEIGLFQFFKEDLDAEENK